MLSIGETDSYCASLAWSVDGITLTLHPGQAHAWLPGTDSHRQPGRGSRACLSAAKNALTPPALNVSGGSVSPEPSTSTMCCPPSAGVCRRSARTSDSGSGWIAYAVRSGPRARASAQAPARQPEAAARQVICSDKRVRGFGASSGIDPGSLRA
jgi:hypothetical protein